MVLWQMQFNFIIIKILQKKILITTRLTSIMHSSQECVSSIDSGETKSIKICCIFLYSIRFRNVIITNKIKH